MVLTVGQIQRNEAGCIPGLTSSEENFFYDCVDYFKTHLTTFPKTDEKMKKVVFARAAIKGVILDESKISLLATALFSASTYGLSPDLSRRQLVP